MSVGDLYKVVHKIGRFRMFHRSRKIELNFLTAWNISMKLASLVQHAPGSKMLPQMFFYLFIYLFIYLLNIYV